MSYSLSLTSIFSGSSATPHNRWMAANFYDKAIFACNSARMQFWPGYNQCLEVPGIDPAITWEGVTVVNDHILGWFGNTMKWCAASDYSSWIPIGETVSNALFTLSGYAVQPAVNASVTFVFNETCEMLVVGQFLRIDLSLNTGFYVITSIDTTTQTVVATLLNLTGTIPAGTTLPTGAAVATLAANDAGELINAGDRINGPILQVVPMGDNAVLFKARSIQLLELGGSTPFYGRSLFETHIVVSDEGLLGKYAWCRSTNEIIYFLGNRELYAYSGGLDMRPVATQQTKQMYAELDLSNADSIILQHVEQNNEIWVVYPVVGAPNGPRRVLIYNYRWDTCTIDDYGADTDGAITALGTWDYQIATPWNSQAESWVEAPGTWYEFSTESSLERLPVIAFQPTTGGATLNVYGLNYDRNGAAISSLCETQDFDFGDSYAFKYIDTVYLALEVLTPLAPGAFKLLVQVGARDNLDSPIRWSDPPWPVEASGYGSIVRQASIRKSGRFIRIRFSSNQVGVQWRISSFRILGRMGSSY
jgi:hypothetical protein